MVFDIKLLRTGLGPWGFRLTGGADFEQPLKVTKVLSKLFYSIQRAQQTMEKKEFQLESVHSIAI